MKIKITKNTKRYNEYKLEIVCTEGVIVCLRNALRLWSERSSVAQDTLSFLVSAMDAAEIKNEL